jgi:hypothetical protein
MNPRSESPRPRRRAARLPPSASACLGRPPLIEKTACGVIWREGVLRIHHDHGGFRISRRGFVAGFEEEMSSADGEASASAPGPGGGDKARFRGDRDVDPVGVRQRAL